MDEKYVLVTDWDLVDEGSFFLTDEWFEDGGKESVLEARKLQKNDKLYVGYIVQALSYCIYRQMDAEEVLINRDGDVIVHGESQVISNNHDHREEYNY